jgi:TIGR03009 family protein
MQTHAPSARSYSFAANSGLLALLATSQGLRAVRRPVASIVVRAAAGALLLLTAGNCKHADAQTTKQPARVAQRENQATRDTEAPRAQQRPANQAAQNSQSGTVKGQAAGGGIQSGRPAQNGAAVNVARPPAANMAPFKLTAKEDAELAQLLASWEEHSSKIDSFKCRFKRWEYDDTYGSKKEGGLNSESAGEIKYRNPDHGKFMVTEIVRQWNDGKKRFEPAGKDQVLEHWVCDGKSIFEYDTAQKQLRETPLPAELQGKAIVDGPLPFIFNAKAATLKDRYWLRDITPKEQMGKQIWLDAHPKRAADARNFSHVELILTEADYNPFALQIYMPGGKNRQVYQFEKIKINDPLGWLKMDFASPSTPFGWKRIVEPVPGTEPPVQAKGNVGKSKADPKQASKAAGDRK